MSVIVKFTRYRDLTWYLIKFWRSFVNIIVLLCSIMLNKNTKDRRQPTGMFNILIHLCNILHALCYVINIYVYEKCNVPFYLYKEKKT